MIARSTLTRFVETLAGQRSRQAVKASLDAWFQEVERAEWDTPADVKREYASASVVNAERVVFNVKGNDYRLIVAVDYRRRIIYIKWIGTHAAYDKIDARTVQYGD